MSKYMYKKNKTFIYSYNSVILRFLPNLQRLNEITKLIKSNVEIFPIIYTIKNNRAKKNLIYN